VPIDTTNDLPGSTPIGPFTPTIRSPPLPQKGTSMRSDIPRARGRRRWWVAAASALAAVALAAPVGANADGPRVHVIARGLDNPRGLTVLHGDTVLVTEAGHGGDGPCIIGAGGSEVCLGQTGAVTAIRHGYERRIARLPSLGNADEALGPNDVAIGSRGELLVTVGLGAHPARRAQLGDGGALLGQVVSVKPFSRTRPVADLAAFESAHDPDQGLPGTLPDSNPYGLLATGQGVVATDAGGNTVLRVGRGGEIAPIAVLPPRFVPGPETGSQIPMQSVPTAVTRGPDGALYVSELTGFPFPKGGAKVWRLEPGEEPEVYAEGFTNVIDIGFDRRGRLHVLEIFEDGLLAPPPEGELPPGRLVRVERDGTQTELADGALSLPGSFAFGRDGSIYVSNKSAAGAGAGEVLRIATSRGRPRP
jgi:hypothetical protein